MIMYTMELQDAEQIEGVSGKLLSGPTPQFGDDIRIPGVGVFRVLRCEHVLVEQITGTFLARVIVIVEVAK